MATPEETPESTPSILERLRERFGGEAVPRISLEEGAGNPAPSTPPTSGVLKRLGQRLAPATRFRIEGELARGGMGAILQVWDEDLRRHMAMKVALGRTDGSPADASQVDPRVLARFLEEAQVTGQLDHPGIVPVHELGLDQGGRVYFTMRLVRGRDLEHVFGLVATAAEGWSVTRALSVLLKACEALAYAHDKGVVHRDLKPANLMVGRFGEVYVMDWGLARVQGQRDSHDVRVTSNPTSDSADLPLAVDRREDISGASAEELYTLDGDVIGTPAYMSPEQARGEIARIDARSDVYAMGAMLYRLLAGTPPYVTPGTKRGAAAILRQLIEGPPRPLEQLAPDAPGELVAITSKAMARESAARYPDMLALAEDLRAFLEGRVVQAFETGALAEARKWIRRNRPLAAALAAGVLALAGGLVTSLLQMRRADDNAALAEERRTEAVASASLAEGRREEAVAAAARADLSAEEARRQARITTEVNRFLNQDLLAAVAPEEMGIHVTVREVLDAASTRLEGRFPGEPLVEAELRMTLGATYVGLGEYQLAGEHFERAFALRKAELGLRHPSTLVAMQSVASMLEDRGQGQAGKAMTLEVIELFREVEGPEHPATLSAMNNLALLQVRLGELDAARELYEQTLALQRRILGPEHEDTLTTLNNLGVCYRELGQAAASEASLEEAASLRRRVSGERHPETLVVLSNLALTCQSLGDAQRAITLEQEVSKAVEEVLGPEHPRFASTLTVLGTFYLQDGRPTEAEPLLRDAKRILTGQLGAEHGETLKATNSLAIVLQDLGRLEECLELRLWMLDAHRRAKGAKHPFTLVLGSNLADLYSVLGRYQDSIELYEETLELSQEVHGPDHPGTLIVLENLSGVYFKMGQPERSLEILPEVLAGRRQLLGDDHPDVAKTLFNMGVVAQAMGDSQRARALFEEALPTLRARLGDEHPLTAETRRQLEGVRADASAEPFD